MDRVNAHHLVVDVFLEAIQTAERTGLGATSCKPAKLHHRSIEPPFHSLRFHFNPVVTVQKGLHAHPFHLASRPEQALVVQVPNGDVFVGQTVLAQPHHHFSVHGVQPIFRKQHFLRAAHHQHAVRLVECDFCRQAIGAHPTHLGPPDCQTSLVRHAMEHAVQHDPTGAGFKARVGAFFGLFFSLNFEVEGPLQRRAKHLALKRGGIGRERASFQSDLKRTHLRLKIPLPHGALPIQPACFHMQLVVQHVVMPTHLMQPCTVPFGQAHHGA